MRKVLLILIAVLLIALGGITLVNGLSLGKINIWSIQQISESSEKLDKKIEEINTLIDSQYPKKITDLKSADNKMKTTKEEYLDYTNLSSDEDILKAMQQESYSIEFLWTKIGNHATSQGVNLKFEIATSSTGANNANDLNFTVQGSYIGITNFIYAIENDENLEFRIQNFKLLPFENEILEGTFTVKNVTIQGNTSNQNISQGNTNTDANTNGNANANNNKTNANSNGNANANVNNNTSANANNNTSTNANVNATANPTNTTVNANNTNSVS